MIPWEREIYVSLLQQYMEEENLKQKQTSGILITSNWTNMEHWHDC